MQEDREQRRQRHSDGDGDRREGAWRHDREGTENETEEMPENGGSWKHSWDTRKKIGLNTLFLMLNCAHCR